MSYQIPALITLLALIEYSIFSLFVGFARGKYGVSAPQTSGDPTFERYFRVHQNTMERLILFLPSLWLFAMYVSMFWSGIVGGVWLFGRALYAWGYYAEPKKRGAGFGIAFLASAILMLGALVGVIRSFL